MVLTPRASPSPPQPTAAPPSSLKSSGKREIGRKTAMVQPNGHRGAGIGWKPRRSRPILEAKGRAEPALCWDPAPPLAGILGSGLGPGVRAWERLEGYGMNRPSPASPKKTTCCRPSPAPRLGPRLGLRPATLRLHRYLTL